jgi:hypothetical protein
LGLPALCGCRQKEDGRTRESFSGRVTFNGQPLKEGYLVLEPQSGQATQSGGLIADGEFNVPEDRGAEPGKYSVAIFAEAVKPTTSAEPGTPEYEEALAKAQPQQVVIPEKYNVKTQVSAEIRAGEPNTFIFDLSSK